MSDIAALPFVKRVKRLRITLWLAAVYVATGTTSPITLEKIIRKRLGKKGDVTGKFRNYSDGNTMPHRTTIKEGELVAPGSSGWIDSKIWSILSSAPEQLGGSANAYIMKSKSASEIVEEWQAIKFKEIGPECRQFLEQMLDAAKWYRYRLEPENWQLCMDSLLKRKEEFIRQSQFGELGTELFVLIDEWRTLYEVESIVASKPTWADRNRHWFLVVGLFLLAGSFVSTEPMVTFWTVVMSSVNFMCWMWPKARNLKPS